MEESEQQYLEAIERLFDSPDMKVFLNVINAEWKPAIASQWRTLKPEQLAFEQGRYDGLEQIANHAQFCKALKEAAELHAAHDAATEYDDV